MAIACLRLLTLPPFPPLPDLNVPFLRRRIALSTRFCAAFPYFRLLGDLRAGILSLPSGVGVTNPRRVGPYNSDAWIWKHGTIVRVSDLEKTKLKRRGRPFRSKDVPAIVELIRPLVPVDPMLA